MLGESTRFHRRHCSADIRSYLGKYESLAAGGLDQWHWRRHKPHTVEALEPVLAPNNRAWIAGRIIQLNWSARGARTVGMCTYAELEAAAAAAAAAAPTKPSLIATKVYEHWYTKLGRFHEDLPGVLHRGSRYNEGELVQEMYHAETQALALLTHLQGTVVPLLYSTVWIPQENTLTRTPAILTECLDRQSGYIPLAEWLQTSTRQNSSTPRGGGGVIPAGCGPLADSAAIRGARQMDDFYRQLDQALSESNLHNDDDDDEYDDAGIQERSWQLVCFRVFFGLRLIHQGGVGHGNIGRQSVLIHVDTLMPVFVRFEMSVPLDRCLDAQRIKTVDLNRLRALWTGTVGDNDGTSPGGNAPQRPGSAAWI